MSDKRIHIHLKAGDLDAAQAFYTKLFGRGPTREREDYLQWKLDDPAVNLSVVLGEETGVGHLGVELSDDAALRAIAARMEPAEVAAEEQGVACCYRRSDKVWYEDPDGVSWETFHSFGDSEQLSPDTACCA